MAAIWHRACSSVVEQGAHNPKVAGSIPAGPTARFTLERWPMSRVVPAEETPYTHECRELDLPSRRSLNIDSNPNEHFIVSDARPEVVSNAASRELALKIADVLSDTPARETLVLDIQQISTVADYFVVTSGENERQVRAVARELLEQLNATRRRPDRMEGRASAGWMLLDYGTVIVHIMDVEQRAFYRLEELWSEAQTLLSIQ